MKHRSKRASANPRRAAAAPRARPQLCPPPATPRHRPAAAGLIFGGAYAASDPLPQTDLFAGREVSRSAEAWAWCEWLRMCLLVAALAAAGIALAPRTLGRRAHAQVLRSAALHAFFNASFAPSSPDHNNNFVALGAIHYSSDDDSTTVTLDLPRLVMFESHRLTNPDRIYFDLAGTKMPADVQGRVIQVGVQEAFVRTIRVAEWKPGVTRLVLETTRNCDYSAMIASDPYRMIVRLHAPQ